MHGNWLTQVHPETAVSWLVYADKHSGTMTKQWAL